MHDGNVIEVRNVSKQFRVYPDKGHSLKEKAVSIKRSRYTIRQVLKDVSFDVRRGESIGLIGHNGCGKSTLLKMLTKIMYPDQGTIEVAGRVSSLLELGAGFHPDMSGRENIYINASIFGMSRREIDEKIQDIIEFSELQEYINNPVRTYSSGMYMRLAFAVAINVNADVLMVDEILAVGDINFQRKCLNKMREMQNAGTTIVLVSHSMEQIMDICDRALWIQDGRIMAVGATDKVAQQYIAYMENINTSEDVVAEERKIDYAGKVSLAELLVNGQNVTENKVTESDNVCIRMHYEGKEFRKVLLNVELVSENFILCFTKNYDNDGNLFQVQEGDFTIDLGRLPVYPGKYYINLRIVSEDGEWIVEEAPLLNFDVVVEGLRQQSGIVLLKTTCCLNDGIKRNMSGEMDGE